MRARHRCAPQVDIHEVPDFNTMYELYDPCTLMFFFRNKVPTPPLAGLSDLLCLPWLHHGVAALNQGPRRHHLCARMCQGAFILT